MKEKEKCKWQLSQVRSRSGPKQLCGSGSGQYTEPALQYWYCCLRPPLRQSSPLCKEMIEALLDVWLLEYPLQPPRIIPLRVLKPQIIHIIDRT